MTNTGKGQSVDQLREEQARERANGNTARVQELDEQIRQAEQGQQTGQTKR